MTSVDHLLPALGSWTPTQVQPSFDPQGVVEHIVQYRSPLQLIQHKQTGHLGLAHNGAISQGDEGAYNLIAALPPIYPEWLGDRGFCEAHRVRFAYVAGAMANGIATARMVIAMARANMLAFFGAAGLAYPKVERNLDVLCAELGTDDDSPSWGANLINSPQEPELEERVADLYIRKGVRRVSASAYMKLSPSIVRYAYSGLRVDAQGQVVRKHHVFAKISRAETAEQFMSPAPKAMLDALVAQGHLTAQEAQLASTLPVAEDIIVESDSGGHTDNRPLSALLPDIQALARKLTKTHQYTRPIRVGAAGGIGTPTAAAAAFAAGAAFVLTGSVNQAAVESGISDEGRLMLAKASLVDVIMAPAADMFELGVEVQVLKRGTMFGPRAKKLHDYYHKYGALEEIPAKDREQLEKRVLGMSVDDVWRETEAFWSKRDPAQVEKAHRDPRHKMALVFRWYLGKASKWAIDGEGSRKLDYQIWCGPAMGSFNTWVEGSFLEAPEARTVVQIALNIMEGAGQLTRAHQVKTFGLPVPAEAFDVRPQPLQL